MADSGHSLVRAEPPAGQLSRCAAWNHGRDRSVVPLWAVQRARVALPAEIDSPGTPREIADMRRLLGLLLLLIQFGPLAGAGLCLHTASQPEEQCATSMDGMPPQQAPRQHHAPTQDCALMAVCAPTAPMVPEGVVQAVRTERTTFTLYSNPPSLLPGDPIAPPQPPPIA